ncbi:trehalose-phosphatase [Loktanella sp. DSM 29012]|uniref:trehalose-phosphatase n=1 Tax=Loktanella sp. DSM 29012 TaxID=1881056 RepID=UPI000B7EA7FD|nr:trehalose-phosphatase [Loktanella sp. DSM 29012]
MVKSPATATDSMTELATLDLRRLYLFLDFDGTLVDLAPTPDAIHVPDDLPTLLAGLHDRTQGRLAIVSGREVAQIAHFLPTFPGAIYGAHGAESRVEGVDRPHPLAGSATVAAVQAAAADLVATDPALLLERKKTGAVVHYRAAPTKGSAVRAALSDMIAGHPDLVLHASKMAWEIRPADASKAGAVQALMDGQPDDVRPVVIGDDTTDEEAMEVAQTMNGICIRVGEGDTIAPHRLDAPSDVHALLRRWAVQP